MKDERIKISQALYSGFTLVELLLYVTMSSMILLSTPAFMSALLEARIKNQTVAEVDGQGLQVMQMITQTIQNSSNINYPATSTDSQILSLNTAMPANDPTIFAIENGAFIIKEGVGATTTLTNTRVTASKLIFSNLSRQNTRGTVRVQFTLNANNISGRQEGSFTKNFVSSATLR